jgi:hypothetical protein
MITHLTNSTFVMSSNQLWQTFSCRIIFFSLSFFLLSQCLCAQTPNTSSYWIANSNTTGAVQTPLSLGNWQSPTTVPSFQLKTTDGGAGTLEIHSTREGSIVQFTRADANLSNVNALTLFSAQGSGSTAALYNASNAATVYLNGQGTSYFTGGSLCIGTTNPGSSQLAVEGLIECQKVTVTQTNPFPDYVFATRYKLPSLDSVSNYIHAHHHLAEVPSADSVAKNGLDLGGTQTVLLKKIEEVTLYLIDQKKELAELKKQNQHLQQRIEHLERSAGAKSN